MSKKVVKELLKEPITQTSLKFKEFEESDKAHIIKVAYWGHEVGGSYVHDYEVAPTYVKDLQYTSNRIVKWTGRSSGGLGSDVYHFEVYIRKIIDKNKPKIEGELLSVNDCYGHFEEAYGLKWTFVHMLYRSHLSGELDGLGVDVKDEFLFVDDEKVAKIIEYKPSHRKHQQGHNTSTTYTYYHGIYDFIYKGNFTELFLNKYKEFINTRLEYSLDTDLRCESVHIGHREHQGQQIAMVFNKDVSGYSEKERKEIEDFEEQRRNHYRFAHMDRDFTNYKEHYLGSNWYFISDDELYNLICKSSPTFTSISYSTKLVGKNGGMFGWLSYHRPPSIDEILKQLGIEKHVSVEVNDEYTTDYNRILTGTDKIQILKLF